VRSCRNSNGPRLVNFTASVANSSTGDSRTISTSATTISAGRLPNRAHQERETYWAEAGSVIQRSFTVNRGIWHSIRNRFTINRFKLAGSLKRIDAAEL
jgi:hypothetical protein